MPCLSPIPKMQFFNSNGAPLVGGQLFTYAAGTTTPQATYSDSTLTSPLANPVVLDGSGEATVWLGPLAYKFQLQDSIGNVQWTVDQIAQNLDGSILTNALANGAVTSAKIAALGVQTSNIALGAVGSAQIGASAIQKSNMALGSVGEPQLDPALDFSQYAAAIEVLFQDPRDFAGGKMYGVPQLPWASPNQLASPVTLPAGQGNAAAWSPNGEFLVVGHTTTPYITIYQRNGATLTKLTDPAKSPGSQVLGVAWSSDGTQLAVSCLSSPFLLIYQRNGVTFTANLNLNTNFTAAIIGVAWSPNSEYLAVCSSQSPYIEIHKSNSTFLPNASISGTPIGQVGGISNIALATNTAAAINSAVNGVVAGANQNALELDTALNVVGNGRGFGILTTPGSIPPGPATAVSWSPDGQYLAVSSTTAPYMLVYQQAGGVFTALTAPTTTPTGQAFGCSWSYDCTLVAFCHSTSPFMSIYSLSGNALTKIANPTTLPATQGNGIAFSPNGQLLAIAVATTPYLQIYQRTGTTFTLMTAPVSLPTAQGMAVAWSPSQEFLTMLQTTTPFVFNYQSAGNFPSNAVLYTRGVLRA